MGSLKRRLCDQVGTFLLLRFRLCSYLESKDPYHSPKEVLPTNTAGVYSGDSDMDDDRNYHHENVNGKNESDNADLFPPNCVHKDKRRSKSISASSIQNGIISALEQCSRNTCTTKSLTKRVLKEVGIITRGNPRLELEKRVKRNVGVLVQKGQVKEYKAKNNRLRLLKNNK